MGYRLVKPHGAMHAMLVKDFEVLVTLRTI